MECTDDPLPIICGLLPKICGLLSNVCGPLPVIGSSFPNTFIPLPTVTYASHYQTHSAHILPNICYRYNKTKKCPTFVASSVCRSRVQIFPLLVVPTFIVLTFVSVYRLDVSGAVILF